MGGIAGSSGGGEDGGRQQGGGRWQEQAESGHRRFSANSLKVWGGFGFESAFMEL
jgi:hypothetical protein